MLSKWKAGDECYYITSNRIPVKAAIKAVQGDFCVLQYGDGKVLGYARQGYIRAN